MPTYATITLDDRSGYARSNEPVVVSIPLAEADNLTSFSSLAIRQSGSIIPAQFQVISRWGAVGDTAAPIRVLQAIFRVASLSANSRDSSTYTLTDGGSGTATGGITVDNAQTNYIEITTGSTAGAGRFRIRKIAGGGHNVLESGEVHTGSAFKTVIATGNASSLYLHGVTTNTQNADYRSISYTSGSNPSYSVAIESSGPERVVILVIGKFGSTPFQGMNDEANRSGFAPTPADMSYEMRYTFWRDSAYVGMEWLMKAPEGTDLLHDAAIDHGGIQIDPNTIGGSGPNIDLFVSVHNNSGTQQGEVLPWATGTPRLFQQVAPNGTGYTWSLNTSGFTTLGSFTQLRESFMVLQRNATGAPPTNDRHLVVMHRGSVNNRPVVSPHGFWYDGTVGCISLWPTEIGEVATSYSRTYHIFPSQMFYNWHGGILLGDGLYSSATVRSQWKRFCNSPIIPWCGAKYQTSNALWYLPPATLTRTGQTDWNEAMQRRIKWGTCLVTSADSSDGRTIQSTYDDRNNNQYSFYYWHTYGAWAQRNFCQSNHYDMVLRLAHTWMITGLPELWEWVDRIGQHMCFVCTHHGGQTSPSELGGLQLTWLQYLEGGVLSEGLLHAAGANFGLGMEINTNMYRPVMYMLTGYQPYKDAVQVLIATKRGFAYASLFDLGNNSTTYYSGLSRRYSWGVEEFLSDFLMQGDTTSLQYARNLAINMLVWTDRTQVGLETAPTQSTTISGQGGMGSIAERGNGEASADQVLFTESTYTAYVQEAIIMAHDIGTWSRAHGYTVFSTGDLALLKTFIQQSTKYMLIGLNSASRNDGSTPPLRGSVVPPLLRGHNKTGGNNTLYASPYEWRWATVIGSPDPVADTRSTDTGYASFYEGTGTISGTSVTSLSPTPTVNLANSFFYVTGEPQHTVRITAHTPGSTTLTLANSYGGLTGSRSVTIAAGGVSSANSPAFDIWAQSLSLFAYAAKLYADDDNPSVSAYIFQATRDLFENLYLYANADVVTNWDQPFAASTRGSIRIGSEAFFNERTHGWHTRRAAHYYLAYEQQLALEQLPVSIAHFVTF